MTGRVAGKVAFITGAARGQGRSHAIRLAQEGADIIAVDLAGQVATVPYAMATPGDLAETVKEVEALDRRIVATQADVRDYGALKAALDDGVAQLGRLDIVSANAGIFSFGMLADLDDTTWQDMIDVNLTGVWHTAKAAIPHLRAAGGGSIILTSSTAGLQALPNTGHYNSAAPGASRLVLSLEHHPTGTAQRLTCDWVACAVPPQPADELWHALDGAPFELHRVGDCKAPRRAHAAVIEGERAAAAQ